MLVERTVLVDAVPIDAGWLVGTVLVDAVPIDAGWLVGAGAPYLGAMPRLKVATTLDATPEQVWADIEDIASHVEWMEDAVEITFTSDIDAGVGTTFDCDTKIGPFRLTDHMEITSWKPGREMGVRHVGMVTGSGVFTLTPVRKGRGRKTAQQTRFVWTERLKFPWYFAGPLGAVVARPLLRHVWRTNLKNLQRRFDDQS